MRTLARDKVSILLAIIALLLIVAVFVVGIVLIVVLPKQINP
jgi:hypothetical protein